MKRAAICILIFFSTFASFAQRWPVAQTEAHPYTRWWWFGNAVDSQNLSYNLEQYAKAGLRGVEITPIYGVQGNDAHDIPFLSPRWMQMLQYTENECHRLHIEADMNTGTGWPFGGPYVSIADAATKAIFQEYTLQKGQRLDVAIEPADVKQQSVAKLSRLMAYSDRGQVVNLTSRVHSKHLLWTAPEGSWRIIALFDGKSFEQVKRASPGGEGLVLDHFSSTAVAHYLAHFEQAFKASATPYPHTFFNDSYEVYIADWSPSLLNEFIRRRGYRLEDHFPEFLDATRLSDGSRPEVTARIVSDYRETLSDMLQYNFTRQWTHWAHSHGVITRNQAHGSPGNLIDLYASVDIPECEGFGLSQFNIPGLRQDSLTRVNYSDLSMMKYASSAAHISGKQYTSAETLTWLTEHFRTSLSQCKPDVDLMFAAGVNHIFFHGTPYSPREAVWPGWLFYASVNMSPTNSIWRDAPAFFEYITRCQSFLQSGKPDNDFLIYLPIYDIWQEQPGRYLAFEISNMKERAPKFIDIINKVTQSGYDVDYVSDAFILGTRYESGRLVTSGGTRYKAIIIPAVRLMPDKVLYHLMQLAGEGADIVFVGNYPKDVPGYGHLASRRALFSKVSARLPKVSFATAIATSFQHGRIITGSDYASTLSFCKAVPEELTSHFGLHYIRRADSTGHIYFISSLQDKDINGWVSLGVSDSLAVFYDPMDGRSGMAHTCFRNGRLQMYLQLSSGQSMIIKTYTSRPSGTLTSWRYFTEQPFSFSLEHGWNLRFVESEPVIDGVFAIDRPVSWTTLPFPDMQRNSGTGVYSLVFNLPEVHADEWLLDLGDVRESARVKINGHNVGTAWAVPFRLYVGRYLHTGKNVIEVEVTNLTANRIADYDRRGVNWRIFKEINFVDLNYQKTTYGHWASLPSGLNSEVKLRPLRQLSFSDVQSPKVK
ncbi:MAG: glycosyl hydrolase [Parabacteroides sp.]|nr:glycosyl hydrolase [Parabacteroides sp.]